MVTGMVAATVSGFAADVEKKWMAQIAPETEGARDRSAERKFAVKIAEVFEKVMASPKGIFAIL